MRYNNLLEPFKKAPKRRKADNEIGCLPMAIPLLAALILGLRVIRFQKGNK